LAEELVEEVDADGEASGDLQAGAIAGVTGGDDPLPQVD